MTVIRGLLATWTGRAIVAGAVALVVGVPVLVGRAAATPAKAELRTAPVGRGAVTQTVAVSGSINAAATVRLSFRTAGRLDAVLVKVGEQVTAGQALARLDLTDLTLAVGQAQANLASAQARYEVAVAGASAEDVSAARLSVDNATRGLDNARRTSELDLATANANHARTTNGYTNARATFLSLAERSRVDAELLVKAADAIAADTRLLFDETATLRESGDTRSARSSLAQAIVPLTNATTTSAATLRAAIYDHGTATNGVREAATAFDEAFAAGSDTAPATGQLGSAQVTYGAAVTRLNGAIDVLSGQLASAQSSVTSAQTSLNSVAARANAEYETFRSSLTTLAGKITAAQQSASATKAKVTQAGASLSTVADAVNGGLFKARQDLASAQDRGASSVATAESQLASAQNSLARLAPKHTEIASNYASLLQAQNALEKAQSDLANATLKAPVSGVVATIGAQVGENVTTGGNTPFMTVANTSSLALHGTVGEADVAKLKLGQVGTVTVDAVGIGTRMTGKVTLIDPVATIQQGVPVYGVDVTLDVPDPQVRPGMSGTAGVILASRSNVLTVPNLAIRTVSGKRVVQVLRGGEVVDADVTLGLSNDTVTEVLSGLEEGELVVLPQRTTAAPAQNQIRVPGGQPGIQVR
ncbi:MAG TPA: efflux RND transporter periplasmic adaptor subunit [Candidatus Limnocylindria bacterium]|nr:efflux RND transporter periplasmic adaptor subunit [Candidatus Limnocylindria bacterium]